jgi:hypothetical protein
VLAEGAAGLMGEHLSHLVEFELGEGVGVHGGILQGKEPGTLDWPKLNLPELGDWGRERRDTEQS